MLKRTKYSRLRNDSLTSLEDWPQKMLPTKRDPCLVSDFVQLDPGAPARRGPSELRGVIPRVAGIRLQGSASLRGQRGAPGGAPADGLADRWMPRTEWGSGHKHRFPSLPLSPVQTLSDSPLHHTKRPITLHQMSSLPWTPGCPPPPSQRIGGLCCSKGPHMEDHCPAAGAESRAVHHHIKYMGSVEVTQSMRTLDFETRMQVTREAISRLCERTSAKTSLKTKRGLSSILGQINLQFSGRRIILTVSAESLTLISASTLQKVAQHCMQAISFASGGDPDMADYIAYVAKDLVNQRACHILECSQGRASEVINSIGQAFETRFRQLLSHTPAPFPTKSRSRGGTCDKWRPEQSATDLKDKEGGKVGEHHEYYNAIPGKTPPPGGLEDLRITRGEKAPDACTQWARSSQPLSMYKNWSLTEGAMPAPPAADSAESDISAQRRFPRCETQIQDLIQEAGWFHGRLGREQAESLLKCSGDFLVRESSSACGQYVLSGLEGATVRHLLLVDPHGQVRTRDQIFLSVGHLVRFHMESQMPIVSGSSELCLKQPILQRQ